jgi:cell shape-determining protein MreC
VTSVDQNDVDSFKQIQVEPFADFTSLDSVAVLVRNGR